MDCALISCGNDSIKTKCRPGLSFKSTARVTWAPLKKTVTWFTRLLGRMVSFAASPKKAQVKQNKNKYTLMDLK
jgi:hypothetical protein